MVSEFTRNMEQNEDELNKITESRASLKARMIEEENDDDTQDDSFLHPAQMKLPSNLLQQYKDIESQIEARIDTWDFNTLRIEDHPILYISIWIFEKIDLLSIYNFDAKLFNEYMLTIEKNYHQENPYHNRFHGADVLQAVYYLSNLDSLLTMFSDLDLLTLYFAAAIHDVDHPGFNNNFLVSTDNPLAILYNNRSVLENHHVSFAFRIHEDIPVWSQLPRFQFRKFRDWSIELVIATDFSQHFGVMGEFKSKVAIMLSFL